MEQINKSNLIQNKWLITIILGGLLLRIFFLFIGGEFYYGSPNFRIQGDTHAWIDSIMNLIKTGSYTSNLSSPNGYFFRPPGYAFIIGIFYFLGGKDLETGLQLLSWAQIILDTIAIWLTFQITRRIGGSKITCLIAAILYATYPFIIVWTPVLYAESISVFFMLVSIYFIVNEDGRKNKYLFSGIFAGLAVLTRLQCIFIIPGLAYYAWKYSGLNLKLKSGLISFALAFGLVYGLWPARNLIFHNRIVFSQDLRIGEHWSPDFMSFMNYILAIKTDHQPQYQQIIENKEVEWPSDAFVNPNDSLLLIQTIEKCKTCGTGFSYFKYHAGLIKEPLKKGQNCDLEIEKNFQKLIDSQKENNKLNFYIITPMQNLKKAFFKFNLYGKKSGIVKLAGAILFSYRTILIFIGLFTIFINYKRKWFNSNFGTLTIIYFFLWYFFISFIYRNMEIRYLLHCDILLIIPVAFLINEVVLYFNKKNSNLFNKMEL